MTSVKIIIALLIHGACARTLFTTTPPKDASLIPMPFQNSEPNKELTSPKMSNDNMQYPQSTANDVRNVETQLVKYSLKPRIETQPTCEIFVPQDSRKWTPAGKQRVYFPIQEEPRCVKINTSTETLKDICLPRTVIWWAEIHLQRGDDLVVVINDTIIMKDDNVDQNETKSGIFVLDVFVYKVNFDGLNTCDSTGGTLLRLLTKRNGTSKVVSISSDIYLDDDVNHLIVTSRKWNKNACVRMTVRVKSQHCGTSGECNGIGMCLTNKEMNSYECVCCPGFLKPDCSEKSTCTSSTCPKNMVCIDVHGIPSAPQHMCECAKGFTGPNCENAVETCESKPCQNGGYCRDTADGFECNCKTQFSGRRCQMNKATPVCGAKWPKATPVSGEKGPVAKENGCHRNLCLNGGICFNISNTITCSCKSGFSGQYCDVAGNDNKPTTSPNVADAFKKLQRKPVQSTNESKIFGMKPSQILFTLLVIAFIMVI